MSDGPVTPLNPDQTAAQEAKAGKEGWLHRDAVAIDQMGNVVFLRGIPDETISAHASRAALEGHEWGKLLSGTLDWFQKNHGPKAQAGDLERAKNVAQAEEKSGGVDVADLKMTSTDGKVFIDVNAGFGGFHSATIECGNMQLVLTAQQLVDLIAPFIEEKAATYVPPASATQSEPDSAT